MDIFTILLVIAIISAILSLYYRYWRNNALGFAVRRHHRNPGSLGHRAGHHRPAHPKKK